MTLATVLPTASPSICPFSCAARSSHASAKAGAARANRMRALAESVDLLFSLNVTSSPHIHFVMRGLDPRIHQKRLFKKMDCRVKPGNDGFCCGPGCAPVQCHARFINLSLVIYQGMTKEQVQA